MGLCGAVVGQSISSRKVVCSNEKLKAARYINLQHVRGRPVYPAWLVGTILGCCQGQGGAIYLFLRKSGVLDGRDQPKLTRIVNIATICAQ
ncbi:hypothetical protein GE21DRAFT_1060400 [Neurospora crassa]|nr:hypothetical protein GE21DRAFT_1060400 [Neurospora crassa]